MSLPDAPSYYPGKAVTFTGTCTNAAGAAADPDALTVKLHGPDGTVLQTAGWTSAGGGTGGVQRTGTGVFAVTWILTAVGFYVVEFSGTGAVQTPAYDYARVIPAPIAG